MHYKWTWTTVGSWNTWHPQVRLKPHDIQSRVAFVIPATQGIQARTRQQCTRLLRYSSILLAGCLNWTGPWNLSPSGITVHLRPTSSLSCMSTALHQLEPNEKLILCLDVSGWLFRNYHRRVSSSPHFSTCQISFITFLHVLNVVRFKVSTVLWSHTVGSH